MKNNQVPGTGSARIFSWICILFMGGFLIPVAKAQTLDNTSGLIKAGSTQHRVKQIYTSQIGVREKHANSGREVDQYLRYVNLSGGNPWCAAFVCWVYGKAGVWNPRSGWSPDLFGSSQVIWGKGQKKKAIKPKAESAPRLAYPPRLPTGNWQQATPGTGDIFGIYFVEKGRIAHVGFIDEWNGTWLITVEGNTNDSGSREGDGVYRKRRLVRTIYKVARYIQTF